MVGSEPEPPPKNTYYGVSYWLKEPVRLVQGAPKLITSHSRPMSAQSLQISCFMCNME